MLREGLNTLAGAPWPAFVRGRCHAGRTQCQEEVEWVVVSLVTIFPFGFSVIPNATAGDMVPIVVRAFLIAMVVFHEVCVLVLLFMELGRRISKQETR
jgi:hypothetical protein